MLSTVQIYMHRLVWYIRTPGETRRDATIRGAMRPYFSIRYGSRQYNAQAAALKRQHRTQTKTAKNVGQKMSGNFSVACHDPYLHIHWFTCERNSTTNIFIRIFFRKFSFRQRRQWRSMVALASSMVRYTDGRVCFACIQPSSITSWTKSSNLNRFKIYFQNKIDDIHSFDTE